MSLLLSFDYEFVIVFLLRVCYCLLIMSLLLSFDYEFVIVFLL